MFAGLCFDCFQVGAESDTDTDSGLIKQFKGRLNHKAVKRSEPANTMHIENYWTLNVKKVCILYSLLCFAEKYNASLVW